jgi:hypothetical protein
MDTEAHVASLSCGYQRPRIDAQQASIDTKSEMVSMRRRAETYATVAVTRRLERMTGLG